MLDGILRQNFLDIMQTVFMVIGFYITARTFINNNRSRRVEFLMEINRQYQDIKNTAIDNPELSRVFEDTPIKHLEITASERFYVRRIINHIYIVFYTSKSKQMELSEGMEKDIRNLFSHTIPSLIWKEMKEYQDDGFVRYIEDLCRTNLVKR